MDRTNQDWTITEGTDVVDSSGDKVGTVTAVHNDHFVVEKGFFFPTDYYIPSSAVSTYDGDKVYLNVTKDQALNQGWDTQPTATTTTETTFPYADRSASPDTTTVTDRDTISVPVQEEELSATRRPVERVSDTVRREEVRVEDGTVGDITTDTARTDRNRGI